MSSFTASLPADVDDDEALSLPAEPAAPPRPSVPLLATLVPVLGGVVLWLATGSMLSLWLAALGPLIAGATLLDGLRTSRRHRRRAAADRDAAHARVAKAIGERHDRERARRREQHPDVGGYVLSSAEAWRAVPARARALVLGSGAVASRLRLSGGGDDPDSVRLRRRGRILDDAPVVVPAVGVIAVVGPPVPASAVARALLLQVCLAHPPGEMRVAGALPPDEAWIEGLPHRGSPAATSIALVGPGGHVPADADVVIVRCEPEAPLPPACTAVLTVDSPFVARLDVAGDVQEIAVEGIALAQAAHIAAELTLRAGPRTPAGGAPRSVLLRPLLDTAPRTGLAAVIGVGDGDGAPSFVDLVADGPHALVAGTTGTGKSELLITWVLALCATRSPREVSLLLADFKGGTAFDALRGLPHVTGVITDLDGTGARRAIESLRAEVRWRESALAAVGARDVADHRVELPRLVVVVDEFAALLGDHPELHAVFTDVAARGRALGMHLVLGTQRVSGVVRDALAANCPLRISLRVADAADSRAVVGTDEATRLPGGEEGRGLALVRRAGDASPERVRIALSQPSDVAEIADAAEPHRPRRPWLPDLPDRIDLAELRLRSSEESTADAGRGPGRPLLLGLADEPERQRQTAVTVATGDRGILVAGTVGTGKSTALRTLAAQAETVLVVGEDPEEAWDAVARAVDAPPPAGSLVVLDDLDALVSRYPSDYAAEFVERLEQLLRGAGAHGFLAVASVQRVSGTVGRLIDLLPRRVVLGAPSRAEYVALGGDPAHHSPHARPGRARVDGLAVQIAVTDAGTTPGRGRAPEWHPDAPITGFAARRSAATRATVAAWQAAGVEIVRVADGAALLESGAPVPRVRTVVVGDAEDWQRHWQLLTAVRDEHALVIDTSLARDVRALSADRALPPYCAPGQPRGWLSREGMPLVRLVLPRTTTPAVAP